MGSAKKKNRTVRRLCVLYFASEGKRAQSFDCTLVKQLKKKQIPLKVTFAVFGQVGECLEESRHLSGTRGSEAGREASDLSLSFAHVNVEISRYKICPGVALRARDVRSKQAKSH